MAGSKNGFGTHLNASTWFRRTPDVGNRAFGLMRGLEPMPEFSWPQEKKRRSPLRETAFVAALHPA